MRRLLEFMQDTATVETVMMSLSPLLGRMERVGGTSRVYDIDGENKKGAIFVSRNGSAVGLGWVPGSSVSTVYFWNMLNLDASPDYAIDIPPGADVSSMGPMIAQMIRTQTQGRVEINA